MGEKNSEFGWRPSACLRECVFFSFVHTFCLSVFELFQNDSSHSSNCVAHVTVNES